MLIQHPFPNRYNRYTLEFIFLIQCNNNTVLAPGFIHSGLKGAMNNEVVGKPIKQ